jgi:hypothetical protein
MSALGIFLYGLVVAALVAGALGLLAWGIVAERRDRRHPEQGSEVFGAPAAAYVASREERTASVSR